MKLRLILSLFVCFMLIARSNFAAETTNWVPCYSEELLEQRLKQQPDLEARLQEQGTAIRAYAGQRPKGPADAFGTAFTVPVVVYVVHQNGPENIPDTQVLAQLVVLNNTFRSYGIRFCLATKEDSNSLPGPTPGIFHVESPLTVHHIDTEEGSLKSLSSLPADRYFRIWVVKDIQNKNGQGDYVSTILGYGTFPGSVPAALDGIVMRYDAFGDATTLSLPNYGEGKVLTHEAGHNLNLFHTFQGGCSGMSADDCDSKGDQVCDTPPVRVANRGCPVGVDSCSESPNLADMVHNHMDYTDDACRDSFTSGQVDRMIATLSLFRATLVSQENLVYTAVDCATSLDPTFGASVYNPCTGATVTFTGKDNPGVIYNWDYGDGGTGTGNPGTHGYASPGAYIVTLTVTMGNDSISSSRQVFVTACSPINSSQGNWFFGEGAGLNFSSGTAVRDCGAHTTISQTEGCVTQSDPSGNLLFYSDGVHVWDHNHALVNSQSPLTGGDSSSQSAFSVPMPSNPNRYYLFTVPEFGSDQFRYTVVDVAGGNITLPEINSVIPLPPGESRIAESITGLQKCDGVNYWVMVRGQVLNSLYVYSVTAAGVALAGSYSISSAPEGSYPGQLKMSPDGTLMACTRFTGSESVPTLIYDFDRGTGVLTNPRRLTQGAYGVSFSPNSRLLYLATTGIGGSLFQYNLTDANPDSTRQLIALVPFPARRTLQIGPDQKIYMSLYNQGYIGVINFANNLASAANPNACGYSLIGPSSCGKGKEGLPNMMDALPVAQVIPDFSCAVSSCLTVAFHAPSCAASYSWSFGDSDSSSLQNPTHTYAENGNYTVTLTVNGTSTVTKNVAVGMTVEVAGPAEICLSPNVLNNYSAVVSQSGVGYSWSASGGTISGRTNGNNVDVVWTALPGTITLMVTNPGSGCSVTCSLRVVEACCTTFGNDAEGWSVINRDATTLAFSGVHADPVHVSNGGNPDGWLQASEEGGPWYWRAPSSFYGNRSGLCGGGLSFDLITDGRDALVPNFPQGVIIGDGSTELYYDFSPMNAINTWKHFDVPLCFAQWKVLFPAAQRGNTASLAQMWGILSHLTTLDILGKFGNGVDTGGIDNVCSRGSANPVCCMSSARLDPIISGNDLELTCTNVTGLGRWYWQSTTNFTTGPWITSTNSRWPMTNSQMFFRGILVP